MKKMFLIAIVLILAARSDAKATTYSVIEYESFFYDLSNTYADVVVCLYADASATSPYYSPVSVYVNLRKIEYYNVGSGPYWMHSGTSTSFEQHETINPRLTVSSAELLADGTDTIRYWVDSGTGYLPGNTQYDNNDW